MKRAEKITMKHIRMRDAILDALLKQSYTHNDDNKDSTTFMTSNGDIVVIDGEVNVMELAKSVLEQLR